jgi:hypothetical protein
MRLKLIIFSPAEVNLGGGQEVAYIYRFEAFEEKEERFK